MRPTLNTAKEQYRRHKAAVTGLLLSDSAAAALCAPADDEHQMIRQATVARERC